MQNIKFVLSILLLIFISCNKEEEKLTNSIEVNYVSTGHKYGKLYKYFNLTETIIKNDEYTMLVYLDTISFKRIDTLKLYKDGKIIFNNVEVKNVDSKNIKNKNKVINVQKIYIPHIGDVSADNFSGEIIYLNFDGIIARYGITSNYISLYEPNIYSDIHNKILYQKIDFKRNKNELDGKP
ncbi:hypothetical protein [Flavobacterium sp.]|uniref:hypothetical protein n=1 Tax=Flavobacterium sp. TaxID=239 RepID=UPI0037508F17